MSETPATETPAVTAPVATPAAETFSKEYVQELRQEAAKARTDSKSKVEAAEEAVRQEFAGKLAEKDTAITETEGKLGAAGVELSKLRTALELNIPSNKVLQFVEILKGSTDDEIKASAESAKELFGGFSTTVPATDPTQGSGGGVMPLNGDPILAALKKAVGA